MANFSFYYQILTPWLFSLCVISMDISYRLLTLQKSTLYITWRRYVTFIMKDLMGSPILKGIDTTTTTPQFNMPPVT